MEDTQNLQETPNGTSQATAGSAAPAEDLRCAHEKLISTVVAYSEAAYRARRFPTMGNTEEWNMQKVVVVLAAVEYVEAFKSSAGAERTSSSALVPPAPSQMLAGAVPVGAESPYHLTPEPGDLVAIAEVSHTGTEGGTNDKDHA